VWPSSGELTDRRYGSRRAAESPISSVSIPSSFDISSANDNAEYIHALCKTDVCLQSNSIAHQSLGRDLKSVILRHFSQTYYGLLINPNSDLAFYNVLVTNLQKLMAGSKSLEYSMLANAASHMHFVDGSPQMQELALTYYSKSIKGLAETLASARRRQDHDAILMSVELLYLHGVSYPKISFRFAFSSCNR
jgi:hypothetical protein